MQTFLDNFLHARRSRKSNESAPHLWAVLLAGGDGVRLRDLTRRIAGDSRPKQFCRIIGGESLFRQTRRRLDPLFLGDRRVFALTRAHEKYYSDDLDDAAEFSVIEQPLNRGTGIAMALAVLHVLQRDPDAMVGFFPCDHFYADNHSFCLTIRSAVECAEQNPEVDYGWIEPGVVVSELAIGPLSTVSRFWEKPSLHEAQALMSRGCLWNTFVTLGRAATFVELIGSQVPEAVLTLSRAIADNTLELAYGSLAAVDFSRDILRHLPHRLLVLRDRSSGWADLGSPARVLEALSRNGIEPEWAAKKSESAIISEPVNAQQ